MPSTAIVIKSYPKDYEWLAYALRSINKFCTGFSEVIVMLPRSNPLALTVETTVLLDTQEGYLHQQSCKLNADYHTQADYILHWDSDMIATRPFTPDFFFHDDKPIWAVTPFDNAAEDEKKAWLHVMVKCLREMPPFEFMRKCAVIAPRWIYPLFREFIQQTHKVSMEQYVTTQPGHEFSEYNCLGFYAWLYQRESFHWHNTDTDGIPDWPWRQFWSWGGLTPEIKAELDEITK